MGVGGEREGGVGGEGEEGAEGAGEVEEGSDGWEVRNDEVRASVTSVHCSAERGKCALLSCLLALLF